MRRTFYIVLIIIYFPELIISTQAQFLKIGLFNESSIQSFIFTVDAGSYELIVDSIHSAKLSRGDLLYISLVDSQLSIREPKSGSILLARANLQPDDSSAVFILRPAFPAMDSRKYQGGCQFSAGIGRIAAINEVQLNDYLSAVVAAEGGTTATAEFYKAQAVLCRTYLLAHKDKHSNEGFNLCDAVHCQAYHGINSRNSSIRKAVEETQNEVAVYGDSVLITAAYHSNCGGETQNSENEWLLMLPYLRSVKDSFCRDVKNSKWELRISKTKWLAYLIKNGVKFNISDSLKFLCFDQSERKPYYIVNSDSIAFRKIRLDWGLKSSFFSVCMDSTSNIVLMGRGYGHGIGMCQVGAMHMAQKGYNYRDILNFYFRDIQLKKAEEISFDNKKIRLYNSNL